MSNYGSQIPTDLTESHLLSSPKGHCLAPSPRDIFPSHESCWKETALGFFIQKAPQQIIDDKNRRDGRSGGKMLHRLLIQLWKFSKDSSQTIDLMKCYLKANGSHVFLRITLQSDATRETELAKDSWSCISTLSLSSCSRCFYSQQILLILTSADFSSSDFSQRKTNKRSNFESPWFQRMGGGKRK